jgi:uncharacterized membrane protein YccC
MKVLEHLLEDDLVGVRFAVNVLLGTAALWLLLRLAADTDPIWAIASMIAAADPQLKNAIRTFHGRIINALLGCVVGLVFVVLGRGGEWTLPFALAVTVLLSSYVIRIPAMWRQAPITAAIVIAASFERHSELTGIEHGLHKVGEVILGCIMGLAVTWVMSKVWPVPAAKTAPGPDATKG